MKFNVNQQDLQQALNYCQGVIEKRSTLPILSNILIDANNSNLIITATDLDLIFIHKINNVEVLEEGKTTTVSSTIYDIVRKLSSGKKINLTLNDSSKLHLESEKSMFNLMSQFTSRKFWSLVFKLDIDPAIATGPFITTGNDVIGILLFFYTAKIILVF